MQAGQEKINKFAKCAVFLFCGDEGLTARRREDYKKFHCSVSGVKLG